MRRPGAAAVLLGALLCALPSCQRERDAASQQKFEPLAPAAPVSLGAAPPYLAEDAGDIASLDGFLAELARCPPGDAPCARARLGLLFEAASLITAGPREAAAPARLRQMAAELLRSVRAEHSAEEVRVALAGLAALAASVPEAAALLRAEGLPVRLHAMLKDDPGPLVQGRALLILGALQPGSPPEAQALTVEEIQRGLAAEDRLLRRLATLAASLARDEALDPALFKALREDLHLPAEADLTELPRRLPADVAVELLPLLPVYVDLLLSTDQPAHSDAALRLTEAAVAADPNSGSAAFFLAQVLDRRARGAALAGGAARSAQRGGDRPALAALRRALSLGNLPAALSASLGPAARALQPPRSVAQDRARVRALLRGRPPLVADPNRVTRADLASGAVQIARVSPVVLEAQAAQTASGTEAALRLGARLFASYPFRSEEAYDTCLRSFLHGDNGDLLEALGLSAAREEGQRRVLGVVQVDGGRYGVTCALCHGQVDKDGRRDDGLPSRSYDQGLLLASCLDQPIHYKSGNRNLEQLMAFQPGRNDSTSDGVHDPTEIPSLYGLRAGRAVRWNGDTPSLEAQIDRNLSPHPAPRAVVRLVADYLRQVPLPPAPPGEGPLWRRGQAVFQRECQRCHGGPAYTTGGVVTVEEVGTDRARVSAVLPNSSAGYKIPSLLRIARSAPYLHDGSVATLERLLDPRRCLIDCQGHTFGHALGRSEREALITFVRGL